MEDKALKENKRGKIGKKSQRERETEEKRERRGGESCRLLSSGMCRASSIRTVRNWGSPGKFCKAICQFWKIPKKRLLRTEVVVAQSVKWLFVSTRT